MIRTFLSTETAEKVKDALSNAFLDETREFSVGTPVLGAIWVGDKIEIPICWIQRRVSREFPDLRDAIIYDLVLNAAIPFYGKFKFVPFGMQDVGRIFNLGEFGILQVGYKNGEFVLLRKFQKEVTPSEQLEENPWEEEAI